MTSAETAGPGVGVGSGSGVCAGTDVGSCAADVEEILMSKLTYSSSVPLPLALLAVAFNTLVPAVEYLLRSTECTKGEDVSSTEALWGSPTLSPLLPLQHKKLILLYWDTLVKII